MEKLVIRFSGVPDGQINWLVWSADEQEIIASGVLDNLEQISSLPERTGKDEAILIVPGSEVTLKTVTLPGKANRKLLSAVPFMLEDELSQDVEKLFFAWHKQNDKAQQVAIVSKSKMQYWLDTLSDAGIYCEKIVPDTLCLPTPDNSWQAIALNNEVIIRQAEWQGITGEANWLAAAVELFAKKQEQKVSIEFSSEPTLHNLANTEISHQPGPLPMQTLAEQAVASQFNLRQEQYKAKKRGKKSTNQWRLAAILAGVAILTTFVDKGIQATQLSNQNEALKEQIVAEFKRAFPETRRIVNVRSQMKQKMEALDQNSSGVSMLAMLSVLEQAFASSQIKPQTMRFDRSRSELRMQAVAEGYESLETFKRLAEQQGFTVEQGAINNRDDQVVGSLAIRS